MREGIVLRDRVVRAGHVDAQHLAEECVDVLAVAHRIAAGATIADAEVQLAVRAEDDVTAIVIAEWLVDLQDHMLGCRVSMVAAGNEP